MPQLTIGVPIRNGERSLVRPVESSLAQVGVDVEVVVSDNASTDGTAELCRAYAASDPRLRYEPLPQNIGLLANFRRVVHLARGKYFRWLGADDWLDPEYGRRCIAALEADPAAVLVTTRSRLIRGGAPPVPAGLRPGPSGDDPVDRLEAILRLLNQGHRAIDPVYSAIRTDVLKTTGLIRSGGLDTDQVLAAELALRGPWLHLAAPLSEREHPVFSPARVDARRFGEPARVAVGRQLRLTRSIERLLADLDLSEAQRRRARRAVWTFDLQRRAQVVPRAAGRMRRSLAVPSRDEPG
jgi:glycosyltransferase involved in cell wall biosynthesis